MKKKENLLKSIILPTVKPRRKDGLRQVAGYCAEIGTDYSMSVLPESARALALPQENMGEVVYSLLPFASMSLTAVRPASDLSISPGRSAHEHTVAIMQ